MTESNVARPTDALIAAVRDLSFAKLPPAIVDRTKDLVLDHLGVSIYGSTLEWCRIVRETIGEEGGHATSTVYGGRMTTARGAALVNGTAGHAVELDDAHDESLSHPGCVVIPAALAMAETAAATGADFLTAIVAGYEVQGRVGAAISSALIKKGYHPTAQLGVFGAAAAASRLIGLSHQQTTWAFGIAASMASGIMKFTQDSEGTMIKRLHGGMPAERGILAAQLAAKGFTGPRDAVEGDYGYATTFTDVTDLSRMTRDIGKSFEIASISVKLYPCCRMFHALIEAIAKCRADASFAPEKIERIEALGPDNMIDGHLERRPRSTMSAQYSLPYTVAVATLGDVSQPGSFEQSVMSRKDVLDMADKVTGEVDPKLQALYPRKYAGRVRFHMKGGSIIEEEVLDSRSTPANPISRGDIEAKFRSITSNLLSGERQDGIVSAVMSLDSVSDLSHLASFLGTE